MENGYIKLPTVALRGLVIFPHMVMNFEVGRKASISSLEDSMLADREIFLVAQRDIRVENPQEEDLYEIGVVAKIRQVLKHKKGVFRVLVEGVYRARVIEMNYDETEGLTCLVESCEQNLDSEDPNVQAHMRMVMDAFEKLAMNSTRIAPEIVMSLGEETDPAKFSDIIAANVVVKYQEKQKILEMTDVMERLEALLGMIHHEIEIIDIERDINNRVKVSMDKMQREHYMREQIRAIQTKLGDDTAEMDEIEGYKKRVPELPISEASKKKILKEISRLSRLQPSSPDYNVALTYIETIMALPWDEYTEDNVDLIHAKEVLDEDHYGMEKVKDRILEYLAVRKKNESMKGPILCFVGPPGVGKTSIARSIAKAMGRKFVRMSLGGVHDEAEIRGHRRTYVGAIPGRIVTSVKQAGSMNPVFLLDEIDKMASDFKGDPASAMLEVLDPEINATFADHYLDIEFDLSKVIFLTTANDASMIPKPLYDRMEIIELSSYTEYEKEKIAIRHLIPKQMKEHGLTEDELRIDVSAVRRMINEYTAESGVRNLERKIAEVCRKAAYQIMQAQDQGKAAPLILVAANDVESYLGVPRYLGTNLPQEDMLGMSIGLAWTAAGGETMLIEVSVMDGSGKIELTGQMGDVMKESATTGISLVRSMAKELGIHSEFYKNNDIHIHIPEGAVPKDGPSAGITMALAVVSALSGRRVRHDIAMTGEITLTGRVLPIGGLKEKSLAAYRDGIRTILIPKENQKDLEELPKEIAEQIHFISVEHFSDVLKEALLP